MTDGWSGTDPQLRRLRSVAVLVLLLLVAYAVVTRADISVVGVLAGALLVDLGFEVGVRFPGTGPK